jgi:hypothetical protein
MFISVRLSTSGMCSLAGSRAAALEAADRDLAHDVVDDAHQGFTVHHQARGDGHVGDAPQVVGAAVDGIDVPAVDAVALHRVGVLDDEAVLGEALPEQPAQGLARQVVVHRVHLGVGVPVVLAEGASEAGQDQLGRHLFDVADRNLLESCEFVGCGHDVRARDSMMGTMRYRQLLVMLLLLAACRAPDPTWPVGPPPRVDDGLLLMQLPEERVQRQAQDAVRRDLERFTQRQIEDTLVTDRVVDPAVLQEVARHRVLTGMSTRDVVWCFLSHPTRIRHPGPPGARTFYWDEGRYWVRFDETGRAVAAGRW